MKAKLLIPVVIIVTAMAACTKTGSGATPQISFKSVNATEFSQGDLITFAINYTVGNGNIAGHLYMQKITLNCKADSFSELDSIPPGVPSGKNLKGEIDVTHVFNGVAYDPNGNPIAILPGSSCQVQNQQTDTCIFRFAVSDNANHTSDTVSSPVIVLKN